MKSVVCLLLCCAVLVAAGVATRKGNELRFKAWKKHHHKQYVNAAAERHAFANFQLTLQRVSDDEDATTLNSLADLSPAEFKARYLSGYVPTPDAGARVQYEWTAAADEEEGGVDEEEQRVQAAPDSFDWRVAAPGAVTPVKDQGDCGSCWAFSATEGLESQWYLTTNESIALAPQQTVSCDSGDFGCNGGDLPPAFKYMSGTAGVESEAAYPYTSGSSGETGTCTYNTSAVVAHVNATVPFVYAVPPCLHSCKGQSKYETALKVAVAAGDDGAVHGPPSICVNAAGWQDYKSGVYKKACSGDYQALDHCVQLVGYNGTAPTPYWIVRNSWGTAWGDKGYIYLPIGKNACGVADEVVFPVAASNPLPPPPHKRHHRSAPRRS